MTNTMNFLQTLSPSVDVESAARVLAESTTALALDAVLVALLAAGASRYDLPVRVAARAYSLAPLGL